MKIVDELLPGVVLVEPKQHTDTRGSFVKTYHAETFAALGIPFTPVEEFFSTSRAGVVRGMHFQLPPHDHAKLVYCAEGAVLDVLLDLRRDTPTFGQARSVRLSADNRLLCFMPSGIAHGFLALDEPALMVYKTSVVHSPANDAGVRWNSFGFEWPAKQPIVSPRDEALPAFAAFNSPF